MEQLMHELRQHRCLQEGREAIAEQLIQAYVDGVLSSFASTTHEQPSAADLDAVAAEQKAADSTSGGTDVQG